MTFDMRKDSEEREARARALLFGGPDPTEGAAGATRSSVDHRDPPSWREVFERQERRIDSIGHKPTAGTTRATQGSPFDHYADAQPTMTEPLPDPRAPGGIPDAGTYDPVLDRAEIDSATGGYGPGDSESVNGPIGAVGRKYVEPCGSNNACGTADEVGAAVGGFASSMANEAVKFADFITYLPRWGLGKLGDAFAAVDTAVCGEPGCLPAIIGNNPEWGAIGEGAENFLRWLGQGTRVGEEAGVAGRALADEELERARIQGARANEVWSARGRGPERISNTTPSPALKGSPYHPDAVEGRVHPPYRANPAHDPRSPDFNARKTPEPPDAASVYQNAARGKNSYTWYARGSRGWYRYFSDNSGGVHFSGIVEEHNVPSELRQPR